MTAMCEICGNPIQGVVATIQVDEGIFRVCHSCSKLGTPVKTFERNRPAPRVRVGSSAHPQIGFDEPELMLRSDFNSAIRTAREKMKISQEELGRKINEKLSVIKHLETGRLKPNNILARKIEHFLKIRLLVPEEIEE